jgi:hypothetical protein
VTSGATLHGFDRQALRQGRIGNVLDRVPPDHEESKPLDPVSPANSVFENGVSLRFGVGASAGLPEVTWLADSDGIEKKRVDGSRGIP